MLLIMGLTCPSGLDSGLMLANLPISVLNLTKIWADASLLWGLGPIIGHLCANIRAHMLIIGGWVHILGAYVLGTGLNCGCLGLICGSYYLQLGLLEVQSHPLCRPYALNIGQRSY